MHISVELSRRISQLIDEYVVQGSDDPKMRRLVTQQKVLPLYRSMADVVAIKANGDIVSFLWDDTSHGQIESDARIRNAALFQGSKKYPELEVLIEKPATARVCSYCKGSGIAPLAETLNGEGIVCYCGGLGWVP